MYVFRDTTEVGTLLSLPSEAVMINGEYIEDENSSLYIEGYRTLYTKGRESLKKDLKTEEIGSRNGTKIKTTRYPEREIVVGFQLVAEDNESFRSAFNKLNGILDREESQFIFHDEEDMFFVGTPYFEGDIEEGRNAVKGEWTIYCQDPFKYSVDEYEAESFTDMDGNTTMMVEYGGTVPAHPTFKASFYTTKPEVDETNADDTSYQGNEDEKLGELGNCGYVAFFDSNEHILQFGDPDISIEKPAEVQPIRVSQEFTQAGNFGSAIQQLWKPNQSGTGYSGAPIEGGFYEAYGANSTPSGTTSGAIIGYKWDAKKKTWVSSPVSDSSGSSPSVKYKMYYKATGRTASSVKLTVDITAVVGSVSGKVKKNWKKAKLQAVITVAGKSHTKTIKAGGKSWGKGSHKVPYTFTVSDIQAGTIDLSCKVEVKESGAKGSAGKLSSRSGNTITIPTYTDKTPTNYFLKSSYGSVTQSGWHGATITRELPPDENGTSGAEFYSIDASVKFSIGSSANDVTQCGMLEVMALNKSNDIVAGIRAYKSSRGKNATIQYVWQNEVVDKTTTFNADNKNSNLTVKIEGGWYMISYKFGSATSEFYPFPAIYNFEDTNVTKIVIAAYQWKAQPPMDWLGVRNLSFYGRPKTSENSTEIPFQNGDILTADGKTATVTMLRHGSDEGVKRPDLGALGNDWETLVLTPGTNSVHTSYSAWAGQQPYIRRCRADEAYGRDYYQQLDSDTPYDSGIEYYNSSKERVYPTEEEYNASPTSYYQFMDAGTNPTIYCNSSGTVYSTQPTYEQWAANPSEYYVSESTAPKFSMTYREVFI